MERIKICPNPNCRAENQPSATECLRCDCDLTNVKTVIKQSESINQSEQCVTPQMSPAINDATGISDANQEPQENSENTGDNTEYVKLCPECGKRNKGVAKICKYCRFSLKEVRAQHLPKDISSAQHECRICSSNSPSGITIPQIKFLSPDGQELYKLSETSPIFKIGREQVLSPYLRNFDYVSRCHAEISLKQTTVTIRDLNSTNGTFVNDCRLEQGREIILNNGDKVSLGGFWGIENIGCFVVEIS